jgi:hypothetical protein
MDEFLATMFATENAPGPLDLQLNRIPPLDRNSGTRLATETSSPSTIEADPAYGLSLSLSLSQQDSINPSLLNRPTSEFTASNHTHATHHFSQPAPLNLVHFQPSSSALRMEPSSQVPKDSAPFVPPNSAQILGNAQDIPQGSMAGSQHNAPTVVRRETSGVHRVAHNSSRRYNPTSFSFQSATSKFSATGGPLRKAYTPERRQQVAKTRDVGACFSCKMSKLPVSIIP